MASSAGSTGSSSKSSQGKQQQQVVKRHRNSFELSGDLSDHDQDQDESERDSKGKELAKNEDRAVFCLRIVVRVVLVCAAIAVALGVYAILSRAQLEEFHLQFNSDVRKVKTSIGSYLDSTIGSMDAFITHIVGFARGTNETWPFVTFPGFGIHASKLLRLSDAFHFAVCPIVLPEQKEEWEAYAKEKGRGWVDWSIDVQASDQNYHGPIVREYNVSDSIYGFNGEPISEPGPFMPLYLPVWQGSPVVPTGLYPPYNFERLQLTQSALGIREALTSQQVVIQNFQNAIFDETDSDQVAESANVHIWLDQIAGPDRDTSGPTGSIAYPILDVFEGAQIDSTSANYTNATVAVLNYDFFWRDLLINILPDASLGMVVVISHSCNESFTYQLDGPVATFLGVGDLHDPEYDDMGVSASFSSLMQPSGGEYSSLPINEKYCPKRMAVYPSDAKKSGFVNNEPIIFSVIAASILLFTWSIFAVYDFCVARRQRIVLNSAKASAAVVDSLFPADVRDAVYEENNKNKPIDKGQSFLMGASTTSASVEQNRPAIAKDYPATTILFADLAGFTKWSSTRTPAQVFEMLETFYAEFDKIARKRGVFKVETIGDCYVAVTGLPKPQPDHAIRMTRFARDCFFVTGPNLVQTLKDTMGGDTSLLGFRVGLHSGPVVGGVLRGEKSRFQLFGDTMNTASRMESHGTKGRIHVSDATARELVASGKSHWIKPREDKIVAKGKGEMQTYWIDFSSGGSSGGRSSSVRSSLTADADASFVQHPQSEQHPLCASAISSVTEKVPLLQPPRVNLDVRRQISLPSGGESLGIVVETGLPDEYRRSYPCIVAIEETSVLHGVASPGEVIAEFDGVDTTNMDAAQLYELMSRSAARPKTIMLTSLSSGRPTSIVERGSMTAMA